MPDEFNATVCIVELTVKTTLPAGVLEPLPAETVAVRVKGPPAGSVPPPGVIERAVVVDAVAGALTTRVAFGK
jgi:hypothetical protein